MKTKKNKRYGGAYTNNKTINLPNVPDIDPAISQLVSAPTHFIGNKSYLRLFNPSTPKSELQKLCSNNSELESFIKSVINHFQKIESRTGKTTIYKWTGPKGTNPRTVREFVKYKCKNIASMPMSTYRTSSTINRNNNLTRKLATARSKVKVTSAPDHKKLWLENWYNEQHKRGLPTTLQEYKKHIFGTGLLKTKPKVQHLGRKVNPSFNSVPKTDREANLLWARVIERPPTNEQMTKISNSFETLSFNGGKTKKNRKRRRKKNSIKA